MHTILLFYLYVLQADDTTFVIMENLRSFLATKNPQDPAYYSRNYNEEKNPKVDGFNSEGIMTVFASVYTPPLLFLILFVVSWSSLPAGRLCWRLEVN